MIVSSANLPTKDKTFIRGGENEINWVRNLQGAVCNWSVLSAGTVMAAKSDDGFAAFWTQFLAAVAKSDQRAVSNMIKYPVLYIDEREEADFPVIWKGAFGKSQRKCLAKQKPVRDINGEGNVEYAAFCGSLIYSFREIGTGWRLTDFGEND